MDEMEFNDKQREVIKTIKGPVMVVSCAGSGKTSVITERAAFMIKSGIPARNILVVTFSKAAALEMKDRFIKKYGPSEVKFSTIHSLCYFILAKAFNLDIGTVIKPNEKSTFLFNEYKRLKDKYKDGFDGIYQDYQQFNTDIQLRISEIIYFSYIGKPVKHFGLEATIIAETAAAYIKYKTVIGKIDFDDMVMRCHQLFKAQPDILKEWQNIYQYIMIDEFQDTNIMQAEVFFMLAANNNICVVGDDDQAIYSFRNADVGVFERFLKEYPQAKRINLEINYRSKAGIIQIASKLISNNKKRLSKKFYSSREGKSDIKVTVAEDSVAEASYIVDLIKKYQHQKIESKEIAVLYRIKKNAMVLSSKSS